MAFRNECTRFLDTITTLRHATVEREVQKELELRHTPYKKEMQDARDEIIAREFAETEKQILLLQQKRDLKVAAYREETEKAIEARKVEIVAEVTEKVSKSYDSFILNVSSLVDNTNIKD